MITTALDIRDLKVRGLCETYASAWVSVAGVARAIGALPGIDPVMAEDLHRVARLADAKSAAATDRLLPSLLEQLSQPAIDAAWPDALERSAGEVA